MSRRVLVPALILPAALVVTLSFAQEMGGKPRKVVKTDAQWKKVLTRAEYEVTRNKATEPPFSGRYAVSHAKGVYTCVCCGAPLFSSQAKFDSGTGWPSFWQPIDPKRIDSAPDFSAGEGRVEVMCNDCGAHLGHVFNDGPPPTGLRFCINSLSLKLVPPTAATAKKALSEKAKKAGKGDAPPPTGSQDPTPGQTDESNPTAQPAGKSESAPQPKEKSDK